MSDNVQKVPEEIIIQTGDKTEKHTIEVSPLTIVCPAPDMAASKISYPKRFEITSEVTLYHAQRVQKLHPKFEECWKNYFSKTNHSIKAPSCNPDDVRKMGNGMQHIMGLIDLSLKMTDKRVPIVWKYPETFLHPALQAPLGDLAIYLMEYEKTFPHPDTNSEFAF